jgi:hypothetical protein
MGQSNIKQLIQALRKNFSEIIESDDDSVIITSLRQENQQSYYIFEFQPDPLLIRLVEKKVNISKNEWTYSFGTKTEIFLNGSKCSHAMFIEFSEKIKKVASDISKELVEVFISKKDKKNKLQKKKEGFSTTFNQLYSNGPKRDFSTVKQLSVDDMKNKMRNV